MRKWSLAVASAAAAIFLPVAAGSAATFPTSGFTIWTIAGNGTGCSPSTAACGDGGAATSANLNHGLRFVFGFFFQTCAETATENNNFHFGL